MFFCVLPWFVLGADAAFRRFRTMFAGKLFFWVMLDSYRLLHRMHYNVSIVHVSPKTTKYRGSGVFSQVRLIESTTLWALLCLLMLFHFALGFEQGK